MHIFYTQNISVLELQEATSNCALARYLRLLLCIVDKFRSGTNTCNSDALFYSSSDWNLYRMDSDL
jgi:DNA topoisomerase VI subunit A